MKIKDTFSSGFGDFATLFHDADLYSFVIRSFYTDDSDSDFNIDGEARYHMIVGYTELQNDILLHLVDVEGVDSWDEFDDTESVSFELLSAFIGQHGFQILKVDQFSDDDDDDDNDVYELADDDIKAKVDKMAGNYYWDCERCNNMNRTRDEFCIRCSYPQNPDPHF